MYEAPLWAGGRPVPDAVDLIRRYCGLRWSGGPPEVWAWPYYDAVATTPDDVVGAVDVMCAAAVHPGLSRADLGSFQVHRLELSRWLTSVPVGVDLWAADDELLSHLAELPERFADVSVSLLSKVLHRKRPSLIPIVDRHIIDWYRPLLDTRKAVEAWQPLLFAMRNDNVEPERRLVHSIALAEVQKELRGSSAGAGESPLSYLRATDIAVWMRSVAPPDPSNGAASTAGRSDTC